MAIIPRKILRNYFRNEHGLSVAVRFCHILGLISLPDFYRDPWKNRVHSVYSQLVTVFIFIMLCSWMAACLKYASTDMSEFCSRLFEVVPFVFFVLQGFHFKFNQENVVLIRDIFEVTWRSHRKVDVILAHGRVELLMSAGLLVPYVITCVAGLLIPFVPKPESYFLKIQSIYKLEYSNVLPVPLYIPFVDTSDPRYYIPLYINVVLCAVYAYMLGVISLCNFVLIPHDLRVLYKVLNKYALALGSEHTNCRGVRVFYTDIARGKYVEANLSSRGNKKLGEHAENILYAEYEYFYLKKIVQFEQSLRKIKEKFDNHMKYNYTMLNIMYLSGLCMFMYAFFMPDLLSPIEKKDLTIKVAFFTLCCGSVYIWGELLGTCNVSFKQGLMNSRWYKCSSKTWKAIPFIVQMNQTICYLTVAGLMPFNFETMVAILKTAYSVFNLLRMKSVKGQQMR